MQEEELLQKLRAGEDPAFKELFELYNSMIFNVCCRMLGDRNEAEDVTQNVFLQVLKSIKDFRSESSLPTWLYRIAVNLCLNHQAKLKRQRWISLDLFLESKPAFSPLFASSGEYQPDMILERKEMEVIVQNALNLLPKQQRIAVILHRYEGLSYQEIAKVLECSVASVESRIFRGKQNLCKKLLPYLKNI